MDLENSHHFLATIAVHSLLCITAFISTMISRVFYMMSNITVGPPLTKSLQ